MAGTLRLVFASSWMITAAFFIERSIALPLVRGATGTGREATRRMGYPVSPAFVRKIHSVRRGSSIRSRNLEAEAHKRRIASAICLKLFVSAQIDHKYM